MRRVRAVFGGGPWQDRANGGTGRRWRVVTVGKASKQKQKSRADKARRRAKRIAGRSAGASGWDESWSAAPPSLEEIAAEVIGGAIYEACQGNQAGAEEFIKILATEQVPGWTQTVSRHLARALRAGVSGAWRNGWQPAELSRYVARELGSVHALVVGAMMTSEMRGYPSATVDDRWATQVRLLDGNPWWDKDDDFLDPLARGADVTTVVALVHQLQHLPMLERLCPLPGEARAGGRVRSDADERVLSKIRALLAKAESTEFSEEAEALSARAQELMAKYSIDHALLAAATGSKEEPAGRRLMIDNPYEEPKASLLETIAGANRCRTIWHTALGMSTVVGFPADLDAVELLFTSLLVQANTAMLREGAKRDAHGRSRTRAFRQSFLIAYAVRIGERLSKVASHTERDAAAASPGSDLLPVLAARHRAVDDAMDEMFGGRLMSLSGGKRVTDSEGWYSGRAAADLATLHNREQVAPPG
jgi:hypothetical protein